MKSANEELINKTNELHTSYLLIQYQLLKEYLKNMRTPFLVVLIFSFPPVQVFKFQILIHHELAQAFWI